MTRTVPLHAVRDLVDVAMIVQLGPRRWLSKEWGLRGESALSAWVGWLDHHGCARRRR